MKIGFVVPALATERALLVDCVANLRRALAAVPGLSGQIVVAFQGEETVPDLGADGENVAIQVLLLNRNGVSAARNRALEMLEGRVEAVMFVDVSVRPDAAFLRAAVAALPHDRVVTAPVGFANPGEAPVTAGPGRVGTLPMRAAVLRGFVWSTIFGIETIQGLRFSEAMGPGTASRHQAGEDARFLFAVWRRTGLSQIAFLPDVRVNRLPRTDLAAKVARYAWGQGWLVGRYPGLPGLSLADRGYFLWRGALFIANSLRMLLSGATRSVGLTRLRAWGAGLLDLDPTAPPLD